MKGSKFKGMGHVYYMVGGGCLECAAGVLVETDMLWHLKGSWTCREWSGMGYGR